MERNVMPHGLAVDLDPNLKEHDPGYADDSSSGFWAWLIPLFVIAGYGIWTACCQGG